MITKFKKGSSKLAAAAILLVLAMTIFLLIFLPNMEKGPEVDSAAQAANPKLSLSVIYNDSFRWFHSLDRALDFPKYAFKVPDYLPAGYQLENVLYSKSFSKANNADLIDAVTITFVSHFGNKSEHTIEVKASKGHGNLLEHNQLWGAPFAQEKEATPEYRQEAVTVGYIPGTLYTDMRSNKSKPGTGTSFLWQDQDISYAINYDGEALSQKELDKMVQSFVLPQQVKHVRYDGGLNSFPLYDEKDLLAAKKILEINLKVPLELPNTGLKLTDTTLLRAGDQNTHYTFRQTTDALWTSYRAPSNSSNHDLDDFFSIYQSKESLFDTSELTLTRHMNINGIEILCYEDKNHVYFPAIYSNSKNKDVNLPYYLWKQDGIYYTAIFLGMDKYQEDNLKDMVMASTQ